MCRPEDGYGEMRQQFGYALYMVAMAVSDENGTKRKPCCSSAVSTVTPRRDRQLLHAGRCEAANVVILECAMVAR